MKGTGQSIKVLLPDQFEAGKTSVTSRTGFELLCTYNWAPTEFPSIYVPGKSLSSLAVVKNAV